MLCWDAVHIYHLNIHWHTVMCTGYKIQLDIFFGLVGLDSVVVFCFHSRLYLYKMCVCVSETAT